MKRTLGRKTKRQYPRCGHRYTGRMTVRMLQDHFGTHAFRVCVECGTWAENPMSHKEAGITATYSDGS